MDPESHADVLDLAFRGSVPEEVNAVRGRWRACHGRLDPSSPARSFLIVTPLGAPFRHVIEQVLTNEHITIERRIAIEDWPAVSTLIYARTDGDERLRVALLFERLWTATTLYRTAERWDLASRDELIRLIALKPRLQATLGTLQFRISAPDVAVHSPHRIVHLRAIHVPDLDRFESESRILDDLTEV